MIGSVKSLWRYPVKSMLGEKLEQVTINSRGVIGDRAYALVTQEGKLGSGKSSGSHARMEGLLHLQTRTVNERVEVVFPEGESFSIHDAKLIDKLEDFLEMDEAKISVQSEEVSHSNGAYFDAEAIHILTTASLNALQKACPNNVVDERRFRANIVLDTQLLDHELDGKHIKIGGTELQIVYPTERCRMITMDQAAASELPSLSDEANILRTVANEFDVCIGLYAKVIKQGNIKVSDQAFII